MIDQTVSAYIEKQVATRQAFLQAIHSVILENDPTVTAFIEPMMGKEMILYKHGGMMKYGLSSVKNHISLHVLPIYGSPVLHAKYKELIPRAGFQKGCINFETAAELPLEILRQLIAECAPIDLLKIREAQLAEKRK